jgi:L-alanine-DL-glutamate epimerase-like enolase superfamily enzyme
VAVAVDTAVERLKVSVCTIPTDEPESDGTFAWGATTIVIVEAHAGGESGLGYTYADVSAARFVESLLEPAVRGRDATAVGACWESMQEAIRNAGRPGLGQMAISAVDTALWDLKARLLGVPLVVALDAAHERVPVYGSGGFSSYSTERIREQLGGWVASGVSRVKMKVGREPDRDPRRLDAAREAIGDEVELYVDANGAFSRKRALAWAERYADEWGVSWFEEPVSSDDLDGLRLLRDRAELEIAAGEYGDILPYFERMAGAVDCLQADITRCGGITGLLHVGALCDARSVDLSGHCAPQLAAHGLAAVRRLRHLEYFHDHVRIEAMLFDGCLEPVGGALVPDRSRPGNGLELRREEAERWSA